MPQLSDMFSPLQMSKLSFIFPNFICAIFCISSVLSKLLAKKTNYRYFIYKHKICQNKQSIHFFKMLVHAVRATQKETRVHKQAVVDILKFSVSRGYCIAVHHQCGTVRQ